MVPQIVRELVQANNELNFVGFGVISKNSLPLYAGRFYDKVTGRTRIIPKPKKSLMNPYSHQSTIGYLEAMVINKWNGFVSAV
jgi:hypothetical protein